MHLQVGGEALKICRVQESALQLGQNAASGRMRSARIASSACRDMATPVVVSISKSPVYAVYPIIYRRPFNYHTTEHSQNFDHQCRVGGPRALCHNGAGSEVQAMCGMQLHFPILPPITGWALRY